MYTDEYIDELARTFTLSDVSKMSDALLRAVCQRQMEQRREDRRGRHPDDYPIYVTVLVNGRKRVNTYWSRKITCEHCNVARAPRNAAVSHNQAIELLISYINAGRVAHGLHPVMSHPILMLSAQAKADDMHANHYYDHIDLDGNGPRYAENLVGPRPYNKAHEAFDAWSRSKGHHDNQMDPAHQFVGVGISDAAWVLHMADVA